MTKARHQGLAPRLDYCSARLTQSLTPRLDYCSKPTRSRCLHRPDPKLDTKARLLFQAHHGVGAYTGLARSDYCSETLYVPCRSRFCTFRCAAVFVPSMATHAGKAGNEEVGQPPPAGTDGNEEDGNAEGQPPLSSLSGTEPENTKTEPENTKTEPVKDTRGSV